MEQITSLSERITTLKDIALSLQEGAIHTRLLPEVDKILALPDELGPTTVGEREAIARQVREYEQTFDSMGYRLLEQLMPSIGVSQIFQVVRAADSFKAQLRRRVGTVFKAHDGTQVEIDAHVYDVLTRYSLSIGTPPVTEAMRELVARVLFGKPTDELFTFGETLVQNPTDFESLLRSLQQLVDASLHYNTAAEEAAFLREACDYLNFEGGRLFNRVVITESPNRVVELIARHLFDKFSPGEAPPLRQVEGVDGLDEQLIERMHAEPNAVFVARVTRIPHRLLQGDGVHQRWRSVIGRLLLIDDSPRARQSNTTIVYTLFPHVARTLRNIQTSLAGRPANTQLQLRRLLERFTPQALGAMREAIGGRLQALVEEGVLATTVEQVRAEDWRRDALFDYLALVKLQRLVAFVERVASSDDAARAELGRELREQVAHDWMRYFYRGLPPAEYSATVVPGGGRGALTLIGEFHREQVRQHVTHFCRDQLAGCRRRLDELKQELAIPSSSTDEIEAGVRQSQLRALSPSQWEPGTQDTTLPDHLAQTMAYRLADAAGRLARRAREGVERAAFGNVTGTAAALFKRTLSDAGFGALHGHLEQRWGDQVGRADRRLRHVLGPVQEVVRAVQRSMDELKGELDPVAVSEIEAVLNVVEQGYFYPTLVLPAMAWSYGDVFPAKDYPPASTIRVPLNQHHELDADALLTRLEELRYLFRRFPELFELLCRSMLLVINSPHNPTGVVYRRETILKLLQIAAEYGLTVVDDNSYHKIVTREVKAREGDACVAQLYERHRAQFSRPVRMITVGATTKGLQGSGDRTGLIHANLPGAVAYAAEHASEPHLMSLYLTQLKLEAGLAAKRYTRQLEQLAAQMLDPTASPWEPLQRLLEAELEQAADLRFPTVAFDRLLGGYEQLLRLKGRDATRTHLSASLSELVGSIKGLRLERRLREDVEQRLQQARLAYLRVFSDDAQAPELIEPQGAFYCCLRLCAADDDRHVREFLRALARHRKVDLTYAGRGFVRLSLGGMLKGDARSYDRLGQVVEVYLRALIKYWQRFCACERDLGQLEAIFKRAGDDAAGVPGTSPSAGPAGAPGGGHSDDALALLWEDLSALVAAHPAPAGRAEVQRGQRIELSERGIIYCIEEGRSAAEKIFVELGGPQPATDAEEAAVGYGGCEAVPEVLSSHAFRVVYRRLLKQVYRSLPALADLSFEQVENQYGPLACQSAYFDRQLIDAVFRSVLAAMYRAWHGSSTIKVLVARLAARRHAEKVAALHGINEKLNQLLNELMFAFEQPDEVVRATGTFEIGYEALGGIEPHPDLPAYLKRVISGCDFAGATVALNPAPSYVTGAVKRVADHRYQFTRREVERGGRITPIEYFHRRLALFAELSNLAHYVCKAVQVGPFKMLLVIHRADFHLICDELRLFPQIEEVQLAPALHRLRWDGVLLLGIPAKTLGDSFKTGYVLDRQADGALLATAWVAREDATDYVGFLKKSLLTLHNEQVKALGGMPVHGAMITITFKNGLRKTVAFSADSGTGKSETITAMMEQLASGVGQAAELSRIDILAGDMLSLWRGEDDQIYAFGTETGDFLRLTDITETWKARFGDLIRRGSFSNLHFLKNPRVTIPGICDMQKVLSPTRVNGFFYINNYEPVSGGAVELSDDPHHVLKHTLVRGLRKNKGTSGDQPTLRAGLEFAGQAALVTRFRHAIDELLEWQERKVDGRSLTCLAYRDGADDIYKARELVGQAFRGREFEHGGKRRRIAAVSYDVLRNLFWLHSLDRLSLPLDRTVYDQIYEPLVSTFCGNPFVDAEGMDRTLSTFAETMRLARVHTGSIKTQLARDGYEFSGPAEAARDVVVFLLEDEEVNARFQRNKAKVHRAMQSTYRQVLEAGSNLPVELEGYNLLLLEAHESTHVAFQGMDGELFTLSTPEYRHKKLVAEAARAPTAPRAKTSAAAKPAGVSPARFVPALALPEMTAAIADICENPNLDLGLATLEVDLSDYRRIRYWNSIDELTYQVLLLNGVISIGATGAELARFPYEVRKAHYVAQLIVAQRPPERAVEEVAPARPARALAGSRSTNAKPSGRDA
ncbi:MAG: aminotransferase class I/II-fold pyridoxal phosphate-dependent enzyme [Proteobacteria bacterium]|nr:aminotransferase class I/II-fold pyridoxal phosphate-dependent enzyme [Pseudomonadota bacterium]